MTSPAGRPWLARDAEAWARQAPSRWWVWVMPAGAAAALAPVFVFLFAFDSEPCTVADPCPPDPTIAVLALLGLSVVLVRWWPLVAAACGAAFSVAEVLFDDLVAARIAFGAYLLLCVALGADVVVRRQRQRRLAAEAARHAPALPPVHRGVRPILGGVALLMVLLGVSQWWLYQRALDARVQHLAGAVTVDTVAGPDIGDFEQRFTLVDPEPWMARSVTLEPLDPVPRGESYPVRIDRDDPSWVEAVAEPEDTSGWLVGLTAALALAVLAAVAALAPLLSANGAGGPRQVLRIRIGIDPDNSELGVLPVDSLVEVAWCRCEVFPVDEWTWPEVEEGADSSVSTLREVSLVGDIRHRGWVELSHADGFTVAGRLLTRPASPRGPDHQRSVDPSRFEIPEVEPVAADDALPPPSLPFVVPSTTTRTRWRARLMSLVVPAMAPAAIWVLAESWWQYLLFGILTLVGPAFESRDLSDPVVDRDWMTVPLGLTRVRVPWSAVREIVHDDASVELEAEHWGLHFVAFPGVPDTTRAEQVRRLARQLRGLSDAAGHDASEPRREVTWFAPYLVLSAAASGAVMIARFVG